MNDKKRNITGSYPGAGGAPKPKKNRNPAGFYPGTKPINIPNSVLKPEIKPEKVQKPAEEAVFSDSDTFLAEESRQAPKSTPSEQDSELDLAEELEASKEEVQDDEGGEKKKTKRKRFRFSNLFSKATMNRYWKTMVYYSCILVVSLLLAAWICHVGNEVLGLIRPDKEITVNIPEKSTVKDIAAELKNAEIIDHPKVFELYCKLKKEGSDFQTGEFTINCKGDYNQLIRALRRSVANKTKVSFTIEPGDTQEDLVVTLCDSLQYLDRAELESVLQEYDFSDYSFLKNLPKRNYRLEGYLYPATYEMYEGESALAVVRRILDKFQEMVLTEENNKILESSSYTLDELITLASIVQAEAGSDLPHAAGVYFNRLQDEDYPYLESQATVAYILPTGHGAVTATDIRVDDPYNTYRNGGLPKGPIANPGKDAIAAVLSPKETEDLYFVTQGDGKTLFSANEAGWKANLKKAGDKARGTGTVS